MTERHVSIPKERARAVASGTLALVSFGSFFADTLLASNFIQTPINQAASAAWPFFLYVGGPLFMYGAYYLNRSLNRLDSVRRSAKPLA